jgi:sugar lactone lactonase YvrE
MTECVVDARCILGEGPVWDRKSARLYWIDIKQRRLHAYRPSDQHHDTWGLPDQPGALALHTAGSLVLALAGGLAGFDPATGETTRWTDPEPDLPGNRLNDGATDRAGRFWFGSMDDGERDRTGALYRFDPDGTIHPIMEGVGIPNSLAFSPNGDVMYFAETLDRTIYAFDYDQTTGTASRRRVFATTEGCYPDGSTVDAEGFLWNAQWGGHRVVRYAPDGRVERIVDVPVENPTSCTFGGEDLGVLYVTSARKGINDLGGQSRAGGLFAFDVGVVGLADTPWGGGRKAAVYDGSSPA